MREHRLIEKAGIKPEDPFIIIPGCFELPVLGPQSFKNLLPAQSSAIFFNSVIPLHARTSQPKSAGFSVPQIRRLAIGRRGSQRQV